MEAAETSDAILCRTPSIHSYAQAQTAHEFFALVESNRGG